MLRKSYQVFSSQFYDLMNLNVSLQKPKNLHKNLYHINPLLSTKKRTLFLKLRHPKTFLSLLCSHTCAQLMSISKHPSSLLCHHLFFMKRQQEQEEQEMKFPPMNC